MIIPSESTPVSVLNPRKSRLIVFLLSEFDPLVKVGGLGDFGGSLPLAISNIPRGEVGGYSFDVRVVMPYHSTINHNAINIEHYYSFEVPTHRKPIKADAYRTVIAGLPIYLIDGKPISRLPGVYGNDLNKLTDKFSFFSIAALHFLKAQNWDLDVLHANDWHSALSLYGIDTISNFDPFLKKTLKVISIHNLPFLGARDSKILRKYCFPPANAIDLPEWAKAMPLPLGLSAADHIVAVSPTYAAEILTPEFGCGLDAYLNTRKDSITGIINGLDTKLWDPENDPSISMNFSVNQIEKRKANKKFLQDKFLLENEDVPLLSIIGRLDYQKGIDIAIEALASIPKLKWQLVILGTGNELLENACRDLETSYPDKVKAVIRFDSELARQLYAGSDMLIMPSRYEPCGLAQMIAMRYGCIPIARATGGLKDTIQDVSGIQPTGFLFKSDSPTSLNQALKKAFTIFRNKSAWREMQKNGMEKDFSWSRSSLEYARIYLNSGGVN